MVRFLPLASLPLCLSACQESPAPPTAPKPALLTPVAHESELLTVALTPQARQRLGIATVTVGAGAAAAVRETSGEIVVPPIAPGGVPTTSLSNLAQIGTQQAAADGEVARTTAAARLARIALGRAEALVREEAGSIRARDEAAAALASAEAVRDAAVAQRRLLGPGIAAMGGQSRLWVRVSVFGSDLTAIRRDRAAAIRALGADTTARTAQPVGAPPSANATAGTVDLYYALDNRDRAWRVGQRVAVALPLAARHDGAGLAVPASAIVRDIYGGEWVYQRTAPDTYQRRRIEIVAQADGQAIVGRGLEPGAAVVTAGAAELFGTEFGAGK
ncbi:efflux RND transporter periplasmic adaptor subunit [Sphingomonas naphthae]|uniref:Efflux RND transporter periplasmic adaptor subunit n=1 Tax=Sphingomonas naphthae TaxID=1813468 RepID=A0ABY7TIL3_9SPHN|nr:efflux RND transporter periplasmic adaptor subunit [Sphingomonas naphthae]WCT73067.1 efflux RND transporter periplasmic adaptor subunit [Sphingomonas naphthae]